MNRTHQAGTNAHQMRTNSSPLLCCLWSPKSMRSERQRVGSCGCRGRASCCTELMHELVAERRRCAVVVAAPRTADRLCSCVGRASVHTARSANNSTARLRMVPVVCEAEEEAGAHKWPLQMPVLEPPNADGEAEIRL